MQNFDFSSKKYPILIGTICCLFVVMIIKAFQYLPEADDSNNIAGMDRTMNINKPVQVSRQDVKQDDVEEENQEDNTQIQPKRIIKKTILPQKEDIEELEPINDISGDDTSNVKKEEPKIVTAQEEYNTGIEYKKSKNYVQALEAFQRAVSKSKDINLQADCYEEISTIYAIVKKYGTALSYAQKAYNLSPTSSREMLLARIYYKTGSIDRATDRINNILQRDFSADR